MNIVGLTGGVATGKTTVSNYLAQLNVPIIDADVINSQLLMPQQHAYAAILKQFPDIPLLDDATFDRSYLRNKIFRDQKSKNQLEEILHPLIKKAILDQIDSLKTTLEPYCIVSAPLLIEANFAHLVTEIWVTDCPESTQIKRLMQRDNISELDATLIMKNQLNRQQRLKFADKIINTENIVAMQKKVDFLHKQQIKVYSM